MVTIDFSAVRPNEIGLECYQKWKDSTFQATYQNAERCLRDMVRARDGVKESFHLQLPDNQNRVMAFVGDRGTGKTSAMVSFVNACVDGSVSVYEPGNAYDREARRCSFYTLPVIEPSGFSDGESIVGCVVSQIYSDLEEHHDKLDRSQIQAIVNQCTDVREAIRVRGMSSQALLEQNSDELSHLRLLAQTKRLRERLGKLIDSYLVMRAVYGGKSQSEVRVKEKGESSYLIVPIDDIDTSIRAAYRLAEELRSYFMLPNVIVVMALKVEQLSDALEQCFINEFKDLYTAGIFLDTQPVAMAAKYIQKLIPEQRRIRMPSLNLTEQSSYNLRTKERGKQPLVGYMLELVYRKTGLLLIPDEWGSHPLIPHNLRALHQMLSLFQEMMDTADLRGSEGQQQYLDQLERAEKWLLGHIASSQIPANLSGILQEFTAHQDQGVNAFLWRALGRALPENMAPEVKALMERSVRNDNISIGDVLHLLGVLEETDVEFELTLFGAAVRMLYSIRIRRGMIQSLELETEDRLVDEALSGMPETGYRRVWQVLNGLVYDPVQRLTYDGFERMYNGDAWGSVLIPISESKEGQMQSVHELRDLYTGAIQEHNEPEVKPMSPKEAVWSSMFIVGFGRVRHRDIHSLESPILTGILHPAQQRGIDADAAFLSSNWMAFAHNLLLPEYTAGRLLWPISSQSEKAGEAFQAEVSELKASRFAVLFQCLYLDSADFLYRLIRHMTSHTEEICQKLPDGLATFNGFFDFRYGLKDGIEKVMKHSCLKEPGTGKDKLDAFLSVPGESSEQKKKDEQNGYQQYDWMSHT